MFKGLANMANLMRMGQQIGPRFEEMQESLKQKQAIGNAGGGMVEATANGLGELLQVKIEPDLLKSQDAEMISSLTCAAVNQAIMQSRELHATEMQSLTEGLDMPGLNDALSQMMGGGK